MIPNYEDLIHQINTLTQQLKNAFEEIQVLKAKNQALRAENQVLRAENQVLKVEIKKLKEKLNTNSTNSSKPPSQDPFRKSKRKEPTGKSQGAQPGHKGYSRSLLPLEQVQIVHDLRHEGHMPGLS